LAAASVLVVVVVAVLAWLARVTCTVLMMMVAIPGP